MIKVQLCSKPFGTHFFHWVCWFWETLMGHRLRMYEKPTICLFILAFMNVWATGNSKLIWTTLSKSLCRDLFCFSWINLWEQCFDVYENVHFGSHIMHVRMNKDLFLKLHSSHKSCGRARGCFITSTNPPTQARHPAFQLSHYLHLVLTLWVKVSSP